MKWVKLIDRTPDTWHLKPVRFIHTKMPILDIEKLLSERPNSIPSIVEWLDESVRASRGYISIEDLAITASEMEWPPEVMEMIYKLNASLPSKVEGEDCNYSQKGEQC